ncbi:MAG: hypothetical protein AAFS10_13595 [Myxococcota bacterium]
MHQTLKGSAAALLAGLALCVIGSTAYAVPARVLQIPNGAINSCGTCHENQSGSGPRNSFGNDVEANLDADGATDWAAIASIDSDGDGFTNGQELGDPEGLWMMGDPSPDGEITNPGDAEEFPSTPVSNGTSNGTTDTSNGTTDASNGTSGTSNGTTDTTTDGGGDSGGDDGGCSVAAGQTHPSAALLVLLGCVLGVLRRRND